MERKKLDIKYKQLTKRIESIKKHFNFTPTISGLTDLQTDKIRGMLLLCHAEFEAHIEGLALLLVEDAYDKWNRTKKANRIMASLFVEAEKINTKESIETKVGKIVSDYKIKIAKNNHGIKASNISTIFKPLGYDTDDFDSAFIATIESFGTDRGLVAHTSAKSTTSMYDQATEINRIDTILQGILDFQEDLLKKTN